MSDKTARKLAAWLIVAVLLCAVGMLALVAAAAQAGAAPVHRGCVRSPGAARYDVRSGVSMDALAVQLGDTVPDMLGITWTCAGGWSPRMYAYLKAGDLSARMRPGTVVWYLPAGGGATAP
jgi:hypothetical protein